MLIASDPSRRLFIEGAGMVERPLEVTPELTGWDAPTARAYQYRAGQVIDGESAGDEMVMHMLRGDLELVSAGLERRMRRPQLGAGEPVALYLPPGERYRAAVRADSLVLYCRAPAAGTRPPAIVPAIAGDVAERLEVREHRAAAGCWTSLPLPPGRSVVYHRFDPPHGWAIVPEHSPGRAPGAVTLVRDGDAVTAAGARHELGVAPGARLVAVTVTARPGASSGG